MIPCSEEEYFYKMDNMVRSSSQLLCSLFKLRWKHEEGKEWLDDNNAINKFIKGSGANAFKKAQPFQKKFLKESNGVADWDISLLSLVMQNFGEESKYDKENDAVRKLKNLRNDLAHHSTTKLTKAEYFDKLKIFKDALRCLGTDESSIAKVIERAGVTSSQKAFERAKVLFTEAEEFMKSGDFRNATERYTEAIKTPSLLPINLGEAYEKRAYCYLETMKSVVTDGDYCDQALLDVKQAVELNSSSWNGYYLAAKCYQRKENLREALKNYETASALSPAQQQVKRDLISCKILTGVQSSENLSDSGYLPVDLNEYIESIEFHYGTKIKNVQGLFELLSDKKRNLCPGQGYVFKGVQYQNGWGVRQDYTEAVRYFTKADKIGNPEGSCRLGECCYFGRGTEQDVKKAMEIFMRVAKLDEKTEGNRSPLKFNAGVAAAKFAVGYLYEKGIGVEKNMTKAAEWYKRAMENGIASAANNLGILYLNGIGVPQDDNMAENCWKRGLNLNSSMSSEYLLTYYLDQFEPDLASNMLTIGREMGNDRLVYMSDEDFNKKLSSVKKERSKVEPTIAEFEQRLDLDSKGLTFKQRWIRSQHFVNSNTPKLLKISEMVYRDNNSQNGLHGEFEDYEGRHPMTTEKLTILLEKAMSGSKIASRVMETLYCSVELNFILGTKQEFSDDDKEEILNLVYKHITCGSLIFHTISIKYRDKLHLIIRELFEKSGEQVGEKDMKARLCYAMFNLWEALISSDDTSAVTVLQVGVSRYPDHFHYQYNLAIVLSLRKSIDESIAMMDKALERFPGNPELLFFRALSLRTCQVWDIKEIIATLKRFVNSTSREHRMIPEAYYLLCSTYLKENEELERDEDTLKQAEHYFRMGTEAEKDQLPCYLPYEESICKQVVQEILSRNPKITMNQMNYDNKHNATEKSPGKGNLKCKNYLKSPIRKDLIRNHRSALKLFRETNPKSYPKITFSPKLQQKVAKKMSLLEPIMIHQMNPTVDKIFENRTLDLLIIDEPNPFTHSIDLVAEDDNGDTILVHLFNIAKDQVTLENLQPGCRISIINPYMRIGVMTNSNAIRNDEPRCVVYLEKVENMCRFCGEGNSVKKCSKCKRPYCSRECQKLDWYEMDHKSICSTNPFPTDDMEHELPMFDAGAFINGSIVLSQIYGGS